MPVIAPAPGVRMIVPSSIFTVPRPPNGVSFQPFSVLPSNIGCHESCAQTNGRNIASSEMRRDMTTMYS